MFRRYIRPVQKHRTRTFAIATVRVQYDGDRGSATHTFPVNMGMQSQASVRGVEFRDVQERLSSLYGTSYQLIQVHGFSALRPKKDRRGVQFTKKMRVRKKRKK